MADTEVSAQDDGCGQCAYDREVGGITIHVHPSVRVERWADRRMSEGGEWADLQSETEAIDGDQVV